MDRAAEGLQAAEGLVALAISVAAHPAVLGGCGKRAT